MSAIFFVVVAGFFLVGFFFFFGSEYLDHVIMKDKLT